MTHPADTPVRCARLSPTREIAGSAALAAYAGATRRRDLQALLEFALRRRLVRVGEMPGGFRDREVAPTGGTGVRDREVAPTGQEVAPTGQEVAPTGQEVAPTGHGVAPARDAGVPVLLERVEVAENLLRLKVSRPPGFDYQAGQHVKMGVPGVLRNYSLVSAPHQDHLEFFVELFSGGRLSERLRSGPSAGAAMALGKSGRGALRVDTGRVNQLLIATVTGVAPYVSFLRDHLHRATARSAPHRRFIVLHGASHADELGYAAELEALARRHPATVTYVPTVSRPESPRNATWTGEVGRVETRMEALVSRLGLGPADTAVFACGNRDMVRNVADAFRRGGFVTHTEPFK